MKNNESDNPPGPIKRAFALLFAGLFVWSAYLQLNDPDPVLWVLVYGIAAALCFACVLKRDLATAMRVFAAFALLGAAISAFEVWFGEPRLMFPDNEMTGWVIVDTEEGREMGGLAIIAIVLALLSINRPKSCIPHDSLESTGGSSTRTQ